MLILKIVRRNVMAHLRKNLVIFTVTSCVCLFLFLFLSFSDGEIDNIKNGVAGFYAPWSDITAVTPNYLHARDHSGDLREEMLSGSGALKKEISSVPGVAEAVCEQWALGTNIYTGDQKYLGFTLRGVDPDDTALRAKYEVTSGRDLAAGDARTILIHHSVAKTTGLKPGDGVTLVGSDVYDQVTSMKVRVVGIFKPNQDNPNLYTMLFLPASDVAVYNGYGPDETNSILIRCEKNARPERVLEELTSRAKETGTEVHFYLTSAEDNETGWEMVMRMVRGILVATALVTLLITAFGIMTATSTNLLDRRKEIGTYYCLGAERPFLMAVYTLEIFAVNLIGSVAGIAGGLVVRAVINALDISSDEPGFQVVAGGSHFYLGLSAGTILWIVGGICLLTILTALTTLGRALRVSPVVAVKETE